MTPINVNKKVQKTSFHSIVVELRSVTKCLRWIRAFTMFCVKSLSLLHHLSNTLAQLKFTWLRATHFRGMPKPTEECVILWNHFFSFYSLWTKWVEAESPSMRASMKIFTKWLKCTIVHLFEKNASAFPFTKPYPHQHSQLWMSKPGAFDHITWCLAADEPLVFNPTCKRSPQSEIKIWTYIISCKVSEFHLLIKILLHNRKIHNKL